MLEIIQWLAVFLSLCGNFFINKKNIVGYYLWLITDIVFFIFAVYNKNYPQIFLFLIYTLFCIHGIYKWRGIK